MTNYCLSKTPVTSHPIVILAIAVFNFAHSWRSLHKRHVKTARSIVERRCSVSRSGRSQTGAETKQIRPTDVVIVISLLQRSTRLSCPGEAPTPPCTRSPIDCWSSVLSARRPIDDSRQSVGHPIVVVVRWLCHSRWQPLPLPVRPHAASLPVTTCTKQMLKQTTVVSKRPIESYRQWNNNVRRPTTTTTSVLWYITRCIHYTLYASGAEERQTRAGRIGRQINSFRHRVWLSSTVTTIRVRGFESPTKRTWSSTTFVVDRLV